MLSVILTSLLSCSDDKTIIPSGNSVTTRIAVISDLHYYDPSLYSDGPAFDKASTGSGKMLAESKYVMKSVIDIINEENVDIVLIIGDLTHQGEKKSHESMSILLKQFYDNGKKVIVIPGNHDIGNLKSYSYFGTESTLTPNINAQEFVQIYGQFGFNNAIYRDSYSLSYISEPTEGLWIFAMDDCRYKENITSNIVGGRFNPQTLEWIKSKISEGKKKGKMMIGMMHHGILEHFTGQKENPATSDFVIDDFQIISQEFAELGLNFVFTGHFHASDIVSTKSLNSFLFDVETGSTSSYPVPVRFVTIKESKTMEIQTKRVTKIDYDTKGIDFQEYTKQKANSFFYTVFNSTLSAGTKIDAADVSQIAPIGAKAYLAHYLGDELIPEEAASIFEKYKNSTNPSIIFYMSYLKSLFTDLTPSDNNIKINIISGEIIN
jgi:3',5'-cyclic AMP phosphodiesterase CpdA